jgi:hypothetical protein
MRVLSKNMSNGEALCAASELLTLAHAVSMFVTGAITREDPDVEGGMHETEAYGYHIIMHDMMDRIKKATDLIDGVRGRKADKP